MSANREAIIEQRAANKAANVDERGPRLSIHQRHWVEGKTEDGKYVLLGGLGAFGVGQMWFTTTDDVRDDPTFADAPTLTIHPDDLKYCR